MINTINLLCTPLKLINAFIYHSVAEPQLL